MKEKIVFLGTPEFAAFILKNLLMNEYNVVAVVTQPDKVVGRKKEITFSPVKELAISHNIPVYQPLALKNDYDFLINLQPDLLITCAYGQILPQKVLDIAKINNINVHASLLPKLRGGAPIQRAIINGDKETGITIMQMVKQMDAGVIYSQSKYQIPEDINSTDLFKQLAFLGADLLLKTLPGIIDSSIKGINQNEAEVTYAYNIKREEEKISFDKPQREVYNLIRGLALTPGGYCYFQNKSLKIYQAKLSDLNDDKTTGSIKVINSHLYVKCLDGYLEILSLQLEGKNKMTAVDFLNGRDSQSLESIILQ